MLDLNTPIACSYIVQYTVYNGAVEHFLCVLTPAPTVGFHLKVATAFDEGGVYMDKSLKESELREALETCAAEPVHIPGIIQPFACLLASNAKTNIVTYASANCDAFLDMSADEVLGKNLVDILGSETIHQLRNLASRSGFSKQRMTMGTFEVAGALVEISAFQSQDFFVFEIEPASDETFGGTDALKSMSFLMAQMQSCETQSELFNLTVELMRHMTGFDRVMIYKFDQEFNGEVIAETCRSSMQPFLGLRFPSWDIPSQARAIMKQIPLRLIEDTDQIAPPLLAASAECPPLDITLAACRGVSSVHMEYLRNLGSKATMTLNITVEGQLWGIISLHHRASKVVAPKLREVLENFVPVFSSKLLSIRQKETLERIRSLDGAIVSKKHGDVKIENMLPEIAPTILEVIDANAIVALSDAATHSFGSSLPDAKLLSALLAFSLEQDEDVVAIDNLAMAFPAFAKLTNGCSGVLITKISDDKAVCIFRNEITKEIAWAGNPEKTIETVEGSKRLTPRGSFSTYLERVQGYSKAWSQDDLYFVRHVRTLLHASERQTLLNTMYRQQSLMIDELNHRVRNILALVRSVSRQARRRYGSLDSYAAAMESRIRALAASHELSAGSLVSPVSITELIKKEFEPYGSIAERQTIVQGKDRNLRAEIAPIFSLVVHELVTNAAKYGALTQESGKIHILLEHLPDGIQITWKERGGPGVAHPDDTGFGTAMIEQAVPHEFGGTAELIFEPDGVRAIFTLPNRHFDDVAQFSELSHQTPIEINEPAEFIGSNLTAPVLILEDNFIIAKEMKDQMVEFGVSEVEVFSNTSDALGHLELEEVSLAILDVNLGKNTSSIPVARKLRDLGVPFFFVTGYGDTAAMAPEMADIPLLTKPVSALELQDQLVRLTT
ncbi:HWE histidine kinase domain-containing protein [uncultured Roseobacter sp.]|uniref:HWE histidine kinase domain-containing protein n=1 Tax=uncultured Roseobacter sp. TaxID=114847 RepID=UPI0026250AAE|nr:HWE histidine kinase domain-containing protein [uncultured Roseobacter sp.]